MGEKSHEELISELEDKTPKDIGDCYAFVKDERDVVLLTFLGSKIDGPSLSNSTGFQIYV